MKILFLDDNLDRHFLVSKSIGRKHQIIHTKSVKECVEAIKLIDAPIDLALLDFNLGDGKISGIELINYMYQYVPPNKWFKNIICHTQNLHSGLSLVSRASSLDMTAHYQPFSQSLLNSLSH